jgi:hypothetical protein
MELLNILQLFRFEIWYLVANTSFHVKATLLLIMHLDMRDDVETLAYLHFFFHLHKNPLFSVKRVK